MKYITKIWLSTHVAWLGCIAGELSLPDPLRTEAGDVVTTPFEWEQIRRPELLGLFQEHVYGRNPTKMAQLDMKVLEQDEHALDGKAIRKQVRITASVDGRSLPMDLLIYLPPSAKQKPVPVFLFLNFAGNHRIHSDPNIMLPQSIVREKFLPLEDFRGTKAEYYQVEMALKRGYGIATAYCGDIDPDVDDGFKNGAHGLFGEAKERGKDSWGTIGAWAWGLSRCMDYLLTDEHIANDQVIVLGHSRLGKAALWAGALDQRFAMVVSNNSGCSGAALARNKQGQTIAKIHRRFHYWFCENYRAYSENEDALPVDQHQLLALIAPRPVYVASATEDKWADPEGEFLSCVHAGPVYELLGMQGLGSNTIPAPDQPLQTGHIGYHLRTGPHAVTAYDMARYMDFADKHIKDADVRK